MWMKFEIFVITDYYDSTLPACTLRQITPYHMGIVAVPYEI